MANSTVCCTDRPSALARSRRASAVESSKRRVIAMATTIRQSDTTVVSDSGIRLWSDCGINFRLRSNPSGQLRGQRLRQRAMLELEPGLVQGDRQRLLPAQHLAGELAEDQVQREAGHDPGRRPV